MQCQICKKSYASKQNLRIHIYFIHENPNLRPHKCPNCDRGEFNQKLTNLKFIFDKFKAFKRGGHLKRHLTKCRKPVKEAPKLKIDVVTNNNSRPKRVIRSTIKSSNRKPETKPNLQDLEKKIKKEFVNKSPCQKPVVEHKKDKIIAKTEVLAKSKIKSEPNAK